MTASDDDPALDALLRLPLPDLPDDGFTEAVMRRVRVEPWALDAASALAHLRARDAGIRRQERWWLAGAGAGAILAAAVTWVAGSGPIEPQPAQALALLVAFGAIAWGAMAAGARET